MGIKKFNQYIKESNSVSEIEIEEFAKEEAEKLLSNLFERMAKKFPIDSSELTEKEKKYQTELIKKITRYATRITKNNISTFDEEEAENTKHGYFEDKPYMNILLEDKAGFDSETDWYIINDIIDNHRLI